jgi:hypothetical protein
MPAPRVQKEMSQRLSTLAEDNQRKASQLQQERDEAARSRAEASAAQREVAELKAQLAAASAAAAAGGGGPPSLGGPSTGGSARNGGMRASTGSGIRRLASGGYGGAGGVRDSLPGPDSAQRRALYSDHSSASESTSTGFGAAGGHGGGPTSSASRTSIGRKATPRASMTARSSGIGMPGSAADRASLKTPESAPGGARGVATGAMTPEEKHIQRMRQVMIKRERASGLSSRCAALPVHLACNCLLVAAAAIRTSISRGAHELACTSLSYCKLAVVPSFPSCCVHPAQQRLVQRRDASNACSPRTALGAQSPTPNTGGPRPLNRRR